MKGMLPAMKKMIEKDPDAKDILMLFFDLFDKFFSFADPSDEEAQGLVNAIPKLLFNTND